MQATEQNTNAKSKGSPTAKVGLTSLGVVVGACILAVHSFSGQAIDDNTLAPLPMTGATLTALHTAIPAGIDEQVSPPSL
jgi:hypothetical protein